jgi:hypothetical protein
MHLFHRGYQPGDGDLARHRRPIAVHQRYVSNLFTDIIMMLHH